MPSSFSDGTGPNMHYYITKLPKINAKTNVQMLHILLSKRIYQKIYQNKQLDHNVCWTIQHQ